MRRLSLIFVVIFGCWCVADAQPLELELNAQAAVLINAHTGKILYQKHAFEPCYPASTTKVATAYYILERLGSQLDAPVAASRDAVASVSTDAKKRANYTLPSHWLETGATHVGIKPGEILSVRDLLYALMLTSANDAANVLAEHVSGSVPTFMEELNQFVRECGCEQTHFTNPHGLHHPQHCATAYELANLTAQALQNPQFRELVTTLTAERPTTEWQTGTHLRQYNRLLRPTSEYHYPRAIGVKTGYTSDAGNCLVAAAEDQGRRLIAVVLGCERDANRYQDVIALFEAAFNQAPQRVPLMSRGSTRYTRRIRGGLGKLRTRLSEDLIYVTYPAEESPVHGVIEWHEVIPPITKGSEVGTIRVLNQGGVEVASAPLYAAQTLHSTFSHFARRTWRGSRGVRLAVKLSFIGGVFMMTLWFIAGRRR